MTSGFAPNLLITTPTSVITEMCLKNVSPVMPLELNFGARNNSAIYVGRPTWWGGLVNY